VRSAEARATTAQARASALRAKADQVVEAESSDETIAGTTAGAGGAETEIVTVDYPPTGSSETLQAWSQVEDEPLDESWGSALGRAAVPLFVTAVVAFGCVVVGVAWLALRNSSSASSPITQTVSAPLPAYALPPITTGPTARDPHDDEFVAMALSPSSLKTGQQNGAGWGTSGTQENANQIALKECRSAAQFDDCMLINTGMFHGCVAYAIDRGAQTKWASGAGPDADSAKAAAIGRLGTTGFIVVQCSNPPGVIKASVAPPIALPPTTTPEAPPPAAGDPAKDAQFIAALKRVNINVISAPQVLTTAHYVCGQLARGATQGDMIEFIKTHGDVSDVGAIDFVADAVAFYCPQYGG